MPNSEVFLNFKDALLMSEELLRIERGNYHNPPHVDEQKAVQGLRGAAAVLMVAVFEDFLKQLFDEHLAVLAIQPPRVRFDSLPDKMQVHSVFQTLTRAMKGPLFQERPPKIQRLSEIDRACKHVISGTVNPHAFSETGANPDQMTVKSMFSNVGIPDIFVRIKPKFDRLWSSPTAQTFIGDKLDEIVQRRHIVAHTGRALDISRRDLSQSIRFLRILANVLDSEFMHYVRSIS